MTPHELVVDQRRRAVLALWVHRMPGAAIARELGVHHSTVQADLEWIRDHWGKAFGEQAQIEPSQQIGQAIAVYDDAEGEAMAEYHLLANVPGVAKSRARMDCLRTAMDARGRRIELLQDLGFLDRRIGRLDVDHGVRAEDIRAILQKEGLLGLTSAGSSSTEDAASTEALMKWLEPTKGVQ
jgi:hypothetical protein